MSGHRSLCGYPELFNVKPYCKKMNKVSYIGILTIIWSLLTLVVYGQEKRPLLSVMISTIDHTPVDFAELENGGKPMLIHFWATWCTHCHNQLDNIAEIYAEWQEETEVKVIAISMDDSRSMMKVGPFTAGKGWDFEIYLDPNGDLKRALNFTSFPHTIIVNGSGEIVWTATTYAPGDEFDMFELIQKLAED